MERNCTACHGSRVKDEFFGLNQDLIDSNAAVYTSSQMDTINGIQPDVHYALAQSINADGYEVGCTLCHSGDEMHGAGAQADGDRYAVTSGPLCEDCHDPIPSNMWHDVGDGDHLTDIACQACHAQPYKNCFGCHTDVDTGDTGLPYYTINEGSPAGTNDALMTFRIGVNPNVSRTYTYAVLRHVPVDADTFKYAVAGSQDGLIPDMTGLPTWKYASPHNIVRETPITEDCNNCHALGGYQDFWLTDALDNHEGWLDTTSYGSDEDAANAAVEVDTPMSMTAD
jgi:thiosulfate/3-mercaptopyruvate sulfurtransferase